MGPKVAIFVASSMVVVGLPLIAAGQTPLLQVRVMLLNDSVVPVGLAQRAQAEVMRLYGLIGVEIEWVPEQPLAPGDVFVVKVTAWEPRDEYPSALGLTPVQADPRGPRAYIFWGRVQRSAQKYAAGFEAMLAVAIAHELGHLLVPAGAHARRGLMHPSWNSEHFRSAAAGLLHFSPESAELIRRSVMERVR